MINDEDKPSLRDSVRVIGELSPVLKSKSGEIIDGKHRLEIDSKWRTEVKAEIDTPEKVLIARLACNDVRRIMPYEEKKRIFNDLAEIESKKNIKGSIASRIEKLTGYSYNTILSYLLPIYKEIRTPLSQDTFSKVAPVSNWLLNGGKVPDAITRLVGETEEISGRILASLFILNEIDDEDFSMVKEKGEVLKSLLEFKPKLDNWIQLLQPLDYSDNR
jgi:hypothetical protein